ncbi:MAG: polyprenol monophosphomannose synthase [Ardenticatenaceae bacterium]|nr:polyprenol monophosphomannose synthase [Ardenticatenaceae bacterium]
MPPSHAAPLTIIVPTRNEAANIAPLLNRLAAALGDAPFSVLFVDDSTDETAQIIAATAVTSPFPIHLIARPPAQHNGLSGAVVEGFRAAQGEWLCVMDADLQHPPEMIPVLLARAQEAGADVVVGSRKAGRWGPLGLSRKRALTSQALTLLARMWFPRLLKNVSDPLTGLFLVRRSAIDVEALRPDGFKILLEILIRCPGLRVSECHFDFAPRHEGDSKADFREGMRFFRHLVRLRASANQSFPRLILVAAGSVLLDTAVFLLLASFTPYWLAAILAAELFIWLRFAVTEKWVLGGGHPVAGWPSWRRFWLRNQLSLLLVRLPLLALLVGVWRWPLGVAGLTAVLVEGGARYVVSEQWVFSRGGLTMWQPSLFRYDLHGLLRLESQVRLPELAWFETALPLPHVDVALRVDRLGTPSPQPGAITYDERLSRFGFGVAIMPGDYTEIVISPALAHAPYALYKSVLEPVLRWALIHRGCALVYGSCVAEGRQAQLIVPAEERGKTEMALQRVLAGSGFLGDDFVILAADGRVYAFPKPVTVTREVLRPLRPHLALPRRQRWRLWLQNLFYSQDGRQTGIQLSQRRWPAATFNIYLQRLLPPPKIAITRLLPQVKIVPSAMLTTVTALAADGQTLTPLSAADAATWLHGRTQAAQGFPPYALLTEQLNQWHGMDGRATERRIIEEALSVTRNS